LNLITRKKQIIPIKYEVSDKEMEDLKLKKIKKLSNFILFFSIFSLILVLFLPWISVEYSGDTSGTLCFNYEMMKQSTSGLINEIANRLNLVILALWCIIILAMSVFLGTILYLSKKSRFFGNLMMLIGGLNVVFHFVVLFSVAILVKDISDLSSVSLSCFLPSFSFAYIILILIFTSSLISNLLVINVFPVTIKYFKNVKKKPSEKHDLKPIVEKTKTEKPVLKQEEPIPKTIAHTKKMETEEWSNDEKTDTKEEPIGEEKVETDEDLSNVKIKQVEKPFFEGKPVDLDKKHRKFLEEEPSIKEEKQEKTVVPVKQKIEETKEVEKEKEPEMEHTFESALSSAIEKKKKEQTREPVQPEKKEEKVEKKKVKVRCLECKHIFTAEIGPGISKFKCPNCGKEGNAK
jgi:hypothetical protein